MKTLLMTGVLCFWMGTLAAQKTEFQVYENNLIYPAKTIVALQQKADEINQKFQTCTPKEYYSIPQAVGTMIILKQPINYTTVPLLQDLSALRDLTSIEREHKIGIMAFIEEDTTYYMVSPAKSQIAELYQFKRVHLNWFVKKNDEQKVKELIYLPIDFQSTIIPNTFGQDIAYVDCMVDTNTSKFLDDAKGGQVILPKNWRDFSPSKKETLLQELRSTHVYGYCSMDDSPRIHARNIALVAAEVGNWEVFLQAHLDIMMDKMERASDGNYAWDARLTYIKELEHMNIHLPSLLLGSALMAKDLSKNHYLARIHRLGRAIAESKDLDVFLARIEEGINDPQMDLANKVRLMVVYLNTAHTLDNELSVAMKDKAKAFAQQLENDLQNK